MLGRNQLRLRIDGAVGIEEEHHRAPQIFALRDTEGGNGHPVRKPAGPGPVAGRT